MSNKSVLKLDAKNEQNQSILRKQQYVREYFLKNGFQDRIPYGINRTGIFQTYTTDAPSEEVALNLGNHNFKELQALYIYIIEHCETPIRYGGSERGTLLEYLVHNDSHKTLPDESHKIEGTLIQWLGTNVGQAFLETYLSSMDLKIRKINE